MTTMTCEQCLHWRSDGGGQCRRHAPHPAFPVLRTALDYEVAWPPMAAAQPACGEYHALPVLQRAEAKA